MARTFKDRVVIVTGGAPGMEFDTAKFAAALFGQTSVMRWVVDVIIGIGPHSRASSIQNWADRRLSSRAGRGCLSGASLRIHCLKPSGGDVLFNNVGIAAISPSI